MTDDEILRAFEAAKWQERAETLSKSGALQLETHSRAGLRAVADAAAHRALLEAADAAQKNKADGWGGILRSTISTWLRARAKPYASRPTTAPDQETSTPDE